MTTNPCLLCGACCAHYRASFYWGECDDAVPGGVPVELTEDLSPFRRAMKGTGRVPPRCVALSGVIGVSVFCEIHPRRPTVCRAFAPSFAGGGANPHCDAARAAHGLPPLRPEDWHDHDEDHTPPVPSPPETEFRPAA